MKFLFEDYLLDTTAAELTCAGERVTLEPKVYDLLVLLLEERERIVSKDEIVERLWQGRFTSDTAITTCVKMLRKALGDDGHQQRFIRTQRGRGLRFIAEVSQAETQPALTQPVVESGRIILDSQQPAALLDPVARQGKPSIIVLPFKTASDNENQIISEAIAHDLIQGLSRLRWIRVIARGTAFQFTMDNPNLAEIGNKLHVRYALCGSTDVLGGKRIILVELSDCESGDVIWAERFETPLADVHETREAILTRVISSLEMYIPLHEASLASITVSDNLDAWANYHLGLRHMFRFNKDDNGRAAHYFNQAIQQDPHFARAYAGLSFTRFQDAFLRYDADIATATLDARRLAEKGVELDSLDPFTNYNMGRVHWLEADPAGGFSWLTRSVELSPNYAQGYYSCAFAELMQGHASPAIDYSHQASHLSPLDPLLYAVYASRALAYLQNNDLANAVIWSEKAARTPGAHYLIQMIAASIHALTEQPDQAKHWRQQALIRTNTVDLNHFFVAFPFVDQGFRALLLTGLKKAGF
ncbi:winged helix-turn-helix domain-containing protein [Neptuniibacter sp. CAU 1671]|uniref:winged helix-turn-helix domain-containing tetratricopeptide repeat protein n=1 Tax=Neptuniibacter sp. CAU 1671 TaxID=3032593 RepID=UPI0023D9BFFD|nr:winged helix-turn-helix domain-containing protein [Neptuniibacter sp. CAU 1671]MDF2182725.1 winged helix-turn-helix domain-containing protein [Neptuniibacter sp. CAU 1671]